MPQREYSGCCGKHGPCVEFQWELKSKQTRRAGVPQLIERSHFGGSAISPSNNSQRAIQQEQWPDQSSQSHPQIPCRDVGPPPQHPPQPTPVTTTEPLPYDHHLVNKQNLPSLQKHRQTIQNDHPPQCQTHLPPNVASKETLTRDRV